MCEQCLAHAKTMFEVVPGFFLVRAEKDGRHMKAGDFGLVEGDDPCMVFSVVPRPEPPEPEGEGDDDFFRWMREVGDFARGFDLIGMTDGTDPYRKGVIDARIVFRLVTACVREGYDVEESGDLWPWLFDRIGTALQKGPFPGLAGT